MKFHKNCPHTEMKSCLRPCRRFTILVSFRSQQAHELESSQNVAVITSFTVQVISFESLCSNICKRISIFGSSRSFSDGCIGGGGT